MDSVNVRIARRVLAIARELVAGADDDVFADYEEFYRDGKWIVQVVRKLNKVLAKLTADTYTGLLPKINECLNYVSAAEGSVADELGTAKATIEYANLMKRVKSAYDLSVDGSDGDEGDGERKVPSFTGAVKAMREYSKSYEQSCVNAFRNRYVEDEKKVRDLLDLTNDCGNDVMNNRIGG